VFLLLSSLQTKEKGNNKHVDRPAGDAAGSNVAIVPSRDASFGTTRNCPMPYDLPYISRFYFSRDWIGALTSPMEHPLASHLPRSNTKVVSAILMASVSCLLRSILYMSPSVTSSTNLLIAS
jgi:hypothetical protein